MRRLEFCLPVLAALLLAPAAVRAESQGKPISLGVFPPVQIVPVAEGISGFRFSLIYGDNAFVNGFDVGLVNRVNGDVTGVQWGLVSIVKGDVHGWQANWAVSLTDGAVNGLQMGVYNQAKHVKGVQLGLVNYTVTMEGIQIGLVNIIKQGGMLPVFPIFNFSFK
jgi:predicted transcriptional regulator with HTH domain